MSARRGASRRAGGALFAFRFVMPVAAGMVFGAQALAGETVRGIIEPNARAELSVEISAPVRRLAFRAGERFRAGDVLVAFDCGRFETALRAARASWKAQSLKARSKRRLVKYQAAGRLEAAIAQAESERARAEADAARLRVKQCKVRAPYDGRVVERYVREYETPGPGKPLVAIVDAGRLEVEMIAPSKWLVWMRPGVVFRFRVDETGETLKGAVVRLGAVVDAVSQTVRVRGVLDNPPAGVLPGMSGTAMFDPVIGKKGKEGS